MQKRLIEINLLISRQVCQTTIGKLTDIALLDEYKKSKSVKKKTEKLRRVLIKSNIESDKIKTVLNDYVMELIPPGTKGSIRGNKFNSIVKDFIIGLKLDKKRFDVCFEKKYKLHETNEIPDWYIYDKQKKKVMIGMNQLDIWRGGQQTNRGSKYLIDFKNTDTCRLVCVICNDVKLTSDKNKAYKLFDIGFANDTLCYIKNLGNIIDDYFSDLLPSEKLERRIKKLEQTTTDIKILAKDLEFTKGD